MQNAIQRPQTRDAKKNPRKQELGPHLFKDLNKYKIKVFSNTFKVPIVFTRTTRI